MDRRTNRICIQDTEPHIKRAAALIHALDIPVKQILIEARLASIDMDYENS